MTPRLVLLTGPAAGEVAQVFRDGADLTKKRDVLPGPLWLPRWDEVRDYDSAPVSICAASAEDDWNGEGPSCCDRVESVIRSLPGGEAWLVGLVLPEPVIRNPKMDGRHVYYPWSSTHARRYHGPETPARLAILAPEPPPLLVERVKAWGGEVWDCYGPEMADFGNRKARETDYDCYIEQYAVIDEQDCTRQPCSHAENTWPEAVRAALGEVAP